MKKLFLCLAALLLCCGLAFACADCGWQVGDQVEGFTVTDVRPFDAIGANLVTLTHDATGAGFLLVENEDTNRAFQISFRTVAENEHGTPHVFEHATLSGSEKYPSAELFINLSYQTYNTYMNASTYPYMTIYPVSSLSEEQLLMYADYYADSCFRPSIMTDESIFRREAWRYSLTSADADLTITGTVYNEMAGSYTIQSAALYGMYKASFPGSTAGNVSGGIPSEIPNMTWAELQAYHDYYYHPSNTVTMLYGKVEHPEAFLRLMNELFSGYERRDFTDAFPDAGYQPLTASVTVHEQYPVEAGTDTEQASVILYSYICPGATEEDDQALDLITTLLNATSSPLMQAVREQLPSATVQTYVDTTGPETMIVVYATGVNPEDAETLAALTQTALEQVIAEGFGDDLVTSTAAAYSMSVRLSLESSELGITMLSGFAGNWATGNLYGLTDTYASLDNFVPWHEDGTYQRVLAKYVTNDPITVLYTMEPLPGAREEQTAQEAEALAAVKAGMTEDEIAALVAGTTDETSATSADTAAMVASLTAVTVESLPVEARIYQVDDTTEDGVRRVHVKASVEGLGETMVRMNVGGLDEEGLLWLQLYIDLLADVDTSAHTSPELYDLGTRYLNDVSIGISLPDEDNEYGFTPYFGIRFKSLDADLMPAWQFVREVVFDSDFSQTDVIAGRVSAYRSSMKQSITSEAYAVQVYRMFAAVDPAVAVYTHVNGVDYYNFLCAVEEMLVTDPASVTAHLNFVRDYLLTYGGNAVLGYVGSDEGYAAHTAATAEFLQGLGTEPVVRRAYEIDTAADSEALIVSTNTNFNLYFASWEELGVETVNGTYDTGWDAVCNLLNDRYLMPILRDERGAYGAYISPSDYGLYVFTYRDPGVAESFDVIFSLGDLLRADTGIDQEVLNGYILSSYSGYALSQGELTGGSSALSLTLNGVSQQQILQSMTDLKAVTVDALPAFADVLDRMPSCGRIATVSGAATITANMALYQRAVDPFGMLTAEPATLADVDESDPYYDAILYCVEYGLMETASDGSFSGTAPATIGDYALPLYMGLGGGADMDEALAFLYGYGLLPSADPNAGMTRQDLVDSICTLLVMSGYPMEAADLSAYADADQIAAGTEAMWTFTMENMVLLPVDGALAPNAPATRNDVAQVLYILLAE